MSRNGRRVRRGFTLVEILLVVALVALLSAILLPDYLKEMDEAKLGNAADQLRSVLSLTRTHAMVDGRRYRIRFINATVIDSGEELDALTARQPVVERESDETDTFGEWLPVKELWAQGMTLHKGIRCDGVRLGAPMFREELVEAMAAEMAEMEDSEAEENSERGGSDSLYPAIVFEPDGTCDWATIILTDAPEDISFEDISSEDDQDAEFVQVILDGRTGLAWLQRFLSEDEETLLKDYGLPPLLRQDFLSTRTLTEDNVRQLSEGRTRQ